MKKELEYTINKINLAKLFEDPYPFLEVNNIFSDNFYKDIIKYKPSDKKYYKPLSKMYSDRFILELGYGENVNNSISKLNFDNQKQTIFWSEFQNIFIEDKSLSECLVNKYSDYINKERSKKGKINCRLSKDLKGYSIGVHRDKKDKLFSCLFYLSDEHTPDKKVNWGTQILVPNQTMEHTDKHHPYNNDGSHDLFDLYKTVTYEPNKMFSWCITENSYHGVPPIIHKGERDSIAFFMKSKWGIK